MIRISTAYGAGLVFGIGLCVSGMVNPAKVLNFLDIFGIWDPSLALVMAGALLMYAAGLALSGKTARPFYEGQYDIFVSAKIDRPLVVGAALFGAGWGLAGLCPGPAVTGLAFGIPELYLFCGAMLAGMLVYQVVFLRNK